MANYFIGSVGTAEAFRIGKNNKAELAFVSKTLTSSSLNISTSKEDIRAGQGASVVANFYHSPVVDITLQDVMWKRAYLEAQLGASFDSDGEVSSYYSEEVTAAAGSLTLKKTPVGLPISCDADNDVVWATKKGSSDWKAYDFTGQTVTHSDFEVGKEYCVRYLTNDVQAREAVITSNIIPEELLLIITAPLYAGDKCAASKSSFAGTITFEVPRFRLNGAQEFSLEMSSTTNMSLDGSALADEGGCDAINGGKLVRIIEVIFAEEDAIPDKIYVADSTRAGDEMTGKLLVYGVFGTSVRLINNAKLTFTKKPATPTGTGTCTGGVLEGTWRVNDQIEIVYTGEATLVDILTVISDDSSF